MESASKITAFGLNDGEKWCRKKYFENPPCKKKVIFVTEFVICGKNLPSYEAL